MSYISVIEALKGGSGSGNFGHSGRPGKIGGSTSNSYNLQGSDMSILYHGGKRKIQKVDTEMLQSRDSGYYGEGFYVTANPDYAKAYGGRLTKIELQPDAKVLNIHALRPQEASPDLVEAVIDNYVQQGRQLATQYGRLDKFERNIEFEVDAIRNSPLEWKNAVDRFAAAKNYDVVVYSDGEIVIRNVDAIKKLS